MEYSAVWNEGLTFDAFVEQAEEKGRVFQRHYREVVLEPSLVERYRVLSDEFGGLKWMILAEASCPDAAQNVPVLAKLAEALGMKLHIFVRSEFKALQDHFETLGYPRIPTVMVSDGRYQQLAIWQERPAAAQALVERIKDGRERGESTASLSQELARRYRSGEFPRDTLTEILQRLEAARS